MKNGIIRRMTALLLMVVCVITATPEALLTTYADEMQVMEILEQTESETEEAEHTEESENVTEETEYMAEQLVCTEIAEETPNIEQTETLTEEIESTEQAEAVTEKIESTEIVTDNTENSGQPEVPTGEKGQLEESVQSEINEQETQTTKIIMETETVSETEVIPETELILETESASEDFGIMLLTDGEETDTTIDASYTDANGITYSYYGYEDSKKQKQIHTDKDGYYCFKGMKKRDYMLNIFDEEENLILKIKICMEETEDEKEFVIMQSCCITVDTEQKHKKYMVNVTI